MKSRRSLRWLLALPAFALLNTAGASVCRGEVTPSGDVSVTGGADTDPWDMSRQMVVGETDYGSLEVNNGSRVTSSASYLGKTASGVGEMTVSDPETYYQSRTISIGQEGSGALNILNSAKVEGSQVLMGYGIGGEGALRVQGAGSELSGLRTLYLGSARYTTGGGRGSVLIEQGGSVATREVQIKDGSVEITGEDSLLSVQDQLRVATSGGQGELHIANGGAVHVAGVVNTRPYINSSGEIHFNNGELRTESLVASLDDLRGRGTIYTKKLHSDFDLTFDAESGLIQTHVLNNGPDQDITLNIDMTPTGQEGFLGAGFEREATLTIADGHLVSSAFGSLGRMPGSSGKAYLSGKSTKWRVGVSMYIGHEGDGLLEISDRAALQASRSYIGSQREAAGVVIVSGEDSFFQSSYVSVGGLGSGELHVKEGAGTYAFGDVNLGDSIGGHGLVRVEGDESFWINSNRFRVGHRGAGQLEVLEGSFVQSMWTVIGNLADARGAVTVSGEDSRLDAREDMALGVQGTGEMIVSEGGAYTAKRGVIGEMAVGTGMLLIEGQRSAAEFSESLTVGQNGIGVVQLRSGGMLRVAELLTIDPSGSQLGRIEMQSHGMLAIGGEAYNLSEYLDLIDGSDAINYWDGSAWENISSAVLGEDYTLDYYDEGDLSGHTVLTVLTQIPEPASFVLLLTTIPIRVLTRGRNIGLSRRPRTSFLTA